MVGVQGDFMVRVGEAFVHHLADGGVKLLNLECGLVLVVVLLQYVEHHLVESVELRLRLRQAVVLDAMFQIVNPFQQEIVETLVEIVLWLHVELQRKGGGVDLCGVDIHPLEIRHRLQEGLLVDDGNLIGGKIRIVNNILIGRVDGGGDVGGVHLPNHAVLGKDGEERHAFAGFGLFLRDGGHDVDVIHLSDRELRFRIEEPYGFDAIALELDTDRVFFGVGEDVEDVAAPGELSRLIDEVLRQVFQFVELVQEIVGENLLAALHGEGFPVDIVLGDYGFRHAFGVGDEDEWLRVRDRQLV